MEKVWLQHYPEGVGATINPDSYDSIINMFDESCKKFASRPAFSNMGKTLTYRELQDLSYHFASYLQRHTNLQPGDRFALQMPNLLQYPVALFGALRAGLIIVNTNPLYTPREMAHQFQDSAAKGIIILENFAANLEESQKTYAIENIIITRIGDLLGGLKGAVVNWAVKNIKKMVPPYSLPQSVSFKHALKLGRAQKPKPVKLNPSDIAFLQYTGGTTGVSKGAILTHRNIIANLEQVFAMIGKNLELQKEIVITPLPLYHIFALTVNCMAFVKIGALNVLITNPRDIPAFIKELSKWKFTVMTGVNTLFNALLNHPKFAKLDFSSLRFSAAGGMALQLAVAEKWKKVTGTPLVEGYGLSETSPVTHMNRVDGKERLGFIGLPVPSTDVKIIDEAGNEAPFGEPGEICIKGPQVMQGYWQKKEETEKVMQDGWFCTGDIAYATEDGYFKIVDRKKDMILVSGFNVYPNEVEDVIASHPGVLEVAAIGVPDPHSGEVVKVFVRKKDANLTESALQEYCKERLTAYKRPKHIEFTEEELPKSNVGKILRRKLREKELSKA
jgi:long-chain acyl-CoA synthetase